MEKKLAPYLADPLAMVFNSFMSVGEIPCEWRSAIITPLYEHGLASDCGNHRPVALTCSLCKVMERVIVLEMTDFLRKHNVISRPQHGFINRRSTTTNLIERMNDWTLALKNKNTRP